MERRHSESMSTRGKEQSPTRKSESADASRRKGSQLPKTLFPPRAVGSDGKYQAHVLLADDDTDMRHMIARSLRRAGYSVVEVEDGTQLLEHLGDDLLESRYQEPDLIVSDIRMPGVTGLEMLGNLRRSDWAMPVVLITAFGDDQTHEESKRLGATLVDKPFELDELLHAVRAILPPRF